jgi:hypothetical protein
VSTPKEMVYQRYRLGGSFIYESHEVIDASRILLGDYLGRLYLLILLVENQHVKDIHLERLGEVCPYIILFW